MVSEAFRRAGHIVQKGRVPVNRHVAIRGGHGLADAGDILGPTACRNLQDYEGDEGKSGKHIRRNCNKL